MAERKSGGKKPGGSKKTKTLPIAVIFWAAFFIVITGVFLLNRETIKRNYTILSQRFNLSPDPASASEDRPEQPEPASSGGGSAPQSAPVSPVVQPPVNVQAPATIQSPAVSPPGPNVQPPPASPPQRQTTEQPARTQAPAPASPPAPVADPPQRTTRPPAPAALPPAAPQPARPAETRERHIYFIRVDTDGGILRSPASRTITVSDSPMLDSLNALLAGPSAEERQRSLRSFIPQNTRILSATVRGGTAYISFSEDFQYNTYGVEGYAAQLNQIVWTVTEFPNIKDVQILIEGRRVDYLGEGIWIGSPINRDSR